jgi:hypothetical protein
MPASSNSPLAREEVCEGTVQFWLSYELTTTRRNIFRIDLANRSGAGRSLRVVEVPQHSLCHFDTQNGEVDLLLPITKIRFLDRRTRDMKEKPPNCEPRLCRDWVFKDPRRRTQLHHPLSSLERRGRRRRGSADTRKPPRQWQR